MRKSLCGLSHHFSVIISTEVFLHMDISTLVTGVEAYVQQRLSQYVEELRDLCAIDSDSYNKAGLDEMARVFARRMQQIGMRPKLSGASNGAMIYLALYREPDGATCCC